MRKYPNEFLGRCSVCLGNAYLDVEPCRVGFGQGQPVNENDCQIRRCQKAYDVEQIKAGAPRTMRASS